MPHVLHKRLGAISIQQGLDFARLAVHIVYDQNVFRIVAQIGGYQVPRLQVKGQSRNKHHHSHGILHHDDDRTINRLGLHPQRPAHNLDGLHFLNHQSGNKPGKETQKKHESNDNQHIDRIDRSENRDIVVQ